MAESGLSASDPAGDSGPSAFEDAGQGIGDWIAGIVYGDAVTMTDGGGFVQTDYDYRAEQRINQPNNLVERTQRDAAREYNLATGYPSSGLPARWQADGVAARWNGATGELIFVPYRYAIEAASKCTGWGSSTNCRSGSAYNNWHYGRGNLANHPMRTRRG